MELNRKEIEGVLPSMDLILDVLPNMNINDLKNLKNRIGVPAVDLGRIKLDQTEEITKEFIKSLELVSQRRK